MLIKSTALYMSLTCPPKAAFVEIVNCTFVHILSLYITLDFHLWHCLYRSQWLVITFCRLPRLWYRACAATMWRSSWVRWVCLALGLGQSRIWITYEKKKKKTTNINLKNSYCNYIQIYFGLLKEAFVRFK